MKQLLEEELPLCVMHPLGLLQERSCIRGEVVQRFLKGSH